MTLTADDCAILQSLVKALKLSEQLGVFRRLPLHRNPTRGLAYVLHESLAANLNRGTASLVQPDTPDEAQFLKALATTPLSPDVEQFLKALERAQINVQ